MESFRYCRYPLIPWIFVMAAGYCFGRVIDLESEQRRRALVPAGRRADRRLRGAALVQSVRRYEPMGEPGRARF